MAVLLQQVLDKLSDQVMDLSNRTVIDKHKTCSVDHKKEFVDGALRTVLTHLPMLVREVESRIRESLVCATLKVTNGQIVLSMISIAVVTDVPVLAPISKFAVRAARSGVPIQQESQWLWPFYFLAIGT